MIFHGLYILIFLHSLIVIKLIQFEITEDRNIHILFYLLLALLKCPSAQKVLVAFTFCFLVFHIKHEFFFMLMFLVVVVGFT